MKFKQFTIVTIFLFIICAGNVSGQKNSVFFGIQPSITVEPFYEEGEFDVNLLPLVYERPVSQRVNLRLLPTVNYHFGGENNGFSDIGFYSVLPIIISKIEPNEKLPYGFYIGPVLGFGRNLLNDHYTTTIAIETGYLFPTEKSFTISLGGQIGGSYFNYDSESNKWVFHWGIKVSFGFWLNRIKEN